jgi:hypothetical protein
MVFFALLVLIYLINAASVSKEKRLTIGGNGSR